MSSEMDALIAINKAARAALAAECVLVRLAFYGHLTVIATPLEQPPAGWLAGRDEADRVCGCTLRRYFTEQH